MPTTLAIKNQVIYCLACKDLHVASKARLETKEVLAVDTLERRLNGAKPQVLPNLPDFVDYAATPVEVVTKEN